MCDCYSLYEVVQRLIKLYVQVPTCLRLLALCVWSLAEGLARPCCGSRANTSPLHCLLPPAGSAAAQSGATPAAAAGQPCWMPLVTSSSSSLQVGRGTESLTQGACHANSSPIWALGHLTSSCACSVVLTTGDRAGSTPLNNTCREMCSALYFSQHINWASEGHPAEVLPDMQYTFICS